MTTAGLRYQQTTRVHASIDTIPWPCSECGDHQPLGQMFEGDMWNVYCSACAEPGDDYLD